MKSRKQLPDYFVESMLKAQKDGDKCCVFFYVNGKIWELDTADLEEVMNEVKIDEIIALYPSEKLASLVQTALETDIVIPQISPCNFK